MVRCRDAACAVVEEVRFAPTRRWRETDSNPRSPVRKIYANTEIAADREQRGRRSAGIGENAERLPNSRAATRPLARFGVIGNGAGPMRTHAALIAGDPLAALVTN